jgi:hypothetical protein
MTFTAWHQNEKNLKRNDAEFEEAQGHANSSSLFASRISPALSPSVYQPRPMPLVRFAVIPVGLEVPLHPVNAHRNAVN